MRLNLRLHGTAYQGPRLLGLPAILATCLALGMLPVAAQTLYWDANGTTAGAGDTPTRIWGVDSFWNTDSAGGAGGVFQIGTLITSELFLLRRQ